MTWTIEFTQAAQRQLRKIDQVWQKKILDYLEMLHFPKQKGKPLSGSKRGFWRYRVADYRIICQLQQQELRVLVLAIAHRKQLYR